MSFKVHYNNMIITTTQYGPRARSSVVDNQPLKLHL